MHKDVTSPFSHLAHIGIVVKDLENVTKQLSALGIGPFQPYHNELDVVPPVKRRLRGKPTECELKIIGVKFGDVVLEFIQPAGDCIHSEFLESGQEGLHHLGFFVDDLDKEVIKLAEKGLTPVMDGSMAKGNFFAYYQPKETGSIIMELVQNPATRPLKEQK